MIRFVFIGDQINCYDVYAKDFAFYDTVKSKFVEIYDDFVFTSVEDFNDSCHLADMPPDEYRRLLELIDPDKVYLKEPMDVD